MGLFGKRQRQDINLIPEEQQVLKTQANKRGLVAFFVIIAVLVIGTYSLVLVLQQTAKAENKRIANETQTQIALFQKEATVAASIKQIQAKYTAYKNQAAGEADFEKKLDILAKATPANLQITALSMTPEGNTDITLRAFSASVAYQFIEGLRADKENFDKVELSSISKVAESSQLNLNMSLLIK